jgi:photosystem II stability/assembly factor-like uncharacterized protein
MSSGKGDLSRLYKTIDACKTWKLVFTNPDKDGFWDTVVATEKSRAYVLGDSVSGKIRIWNISEENPDDTAVTTEVAHLNAEVGESSFAASNSILLIPAKEIADSGWAYRWWWTTTAGDHANIYVLRDERNDNCEPCNQEIRKIEPSWFQFEGSATAGIFSLALSGRLVIAVGGNFKDVNARARTAAYSTDLGLTWHSALTPPHGYRSSVAYNSKTKTWITVGPNGTDISRDDGRNWTALKPTAQDPPDADKNWNALSLPFVVGPKGRIGKLRPEALKP